MSLPMPSPPDSPTSSSSPYGTSSRSSHVYPSTPDPSHLSLSTSFFSLVSPPETAPSTPHSYDDETGTENAGVMIGKSVWLSREDAGTSTSTSKSLPTIPNGHPLPSSSWPNPTSAYSPDHQHVGLGLTGLISPSKNSEGRRLGLGRFVGISSPLPGQHTHRSHKTTFLSSILSRRARPILLLVAFFLVGIIYLLTALRPSSQPVTLAQLRRFHRAQAPSMVTPLPEVGDWVWGQGEEAAALVEFLSSEGTHALPPLSAHGDLDPALVLDFDPYSPNSPQLLSEMVENVWSDRVVVLLGKGYGDPVTKQLRKAIEDLWIVPAPVFIEVTSRHDADHLIPILMRLFNFVKEDELPILLIGGKKANHADLADLLSPTSSRTRISTQIQIAGGSFLDEKLRRKGGRKH